jgi:hypothetical protein
MLGRLVLLQYEGDGKFVDLLPYVAVTNQSNRAMWTLPEFSEFPVLVTADFLWDFDAGETHYANHHYQISAYGFNATTRRYTELLSYKTTHRYPGEDDVNHVRVLGPEREQILRRLRSLSVK